MDAAISEPTRTVSVPAARLSPWLTNFTSRHGAWRQVSSSPATVDLLAADGARATVAVPFPPLSIGADPLGSLLEHVARPRRVGAVLARKGGYAVGVFEGSRLTASKVGSRYVQGRTKAGGWSQQRYARRRQNQSQSAADEAAEQVVRLLLPEVAELDAVVTGGDRVAVTAVLADPRLSPVRALLLPRVHPVPDPRLRVLEAFPEQFLAVEIRLNALA